MTPLAPLRVAELKWVCGLDESFLGDFITLRCSDKSYLLQGLSESYMCEIDVTQGMLSPELDLGERLLDSSLFRLANFHKGRYLRIVTPKIN